MLGFYNVIKPTGVSSGLIVNKIKRLTKEKVGHLGTLDPAASGVLPIAVGKATRFFDYFLKKEKQYIALAKFGVETDTLDSEGQIISRQNNVSVTLEQVQNSANKLIGCIDQMPPLYSSKSVNGVRAYEAARNNQEIKLEPKKVQIDNIIVEKTEKNNLFKLKIDCLAGTYVRSIVRDIAQDLGLKATTVCIIRTLSGKFKMDSAVTLEQIENDKEKFLININDILNFEVYSLNHNQAKSLLDGKQITVQLKNGEYLLMYNQDEFAVGQVDNNKMTNKIYLYSKEFL